MKILIHALLRRLFKTKTNLVIDLLGLSIGILAVLFTSAWIISEKSYHHFWEGEDQKPDQWAKLGTFRNEVQKIPGERGFTTAEIVAGENYRRSRDKVWLRGKEEGKYPFSIAHVDCDYFDFFSLGLLSGEFFNEKTRREDGEIIINQSACNQLGIGNGNVVGHLLEIGNETYRIIGLVKDCHHLSLKDEIKPVIYMNSLYWQALRYE
jgi:putative ABC transport system permease protein